jgi:hypothetical protein
MIKITAGRPHKTLRQSDLDFTFSPDGIKLVPRASFEISQRCPENYRDLIAECINHGWLKPVAYLTERELLMSGLARE